MIEIISAIWNGLEAVCYLLLFSAFLSRKQEKRTLLRISFFLTWVFLFLSANVGMNETLMQFSSIGIAVAFSFIAFSGKWFYHVFPAILAYVFFAVMDTAIAYGVCLLRGISFSDLIWQKYTYLTTATISKLLTVLVCWIIYRFRTQKGTEVVANKWLILTFLFPAISVVMLAVIFFGYQNRPDLSASAILFSGVLAIANVAILYIIGSIEKATRQENEMALLKQQISLQTSHFMTIENHYRSQRKAVHEFERHLQALDGLLSSDENNAAKDYLHQLTTNRSLRQYSVNSHHPVIDVILSQKHQLALEQEIEMHIQVNDLSAINIQTDILVVVLSNLLDNAIEACLRLPEQRQISCSILASESIYFSIRNTSLPIRLENGVPVTSKTDIINHGYGIPTVKYLLDNLGAEYTFDFRDGWFLFVAELPLNQVE